MIQTDLEMRYKYPRTFHVPWSLGVGSDDKTLKSMDHFFGKEVVVTEKMDGENSTLYRDSYHARSITSVDHISRSWLKGFHATIKNDIPEGFRICGENLYAKHSIHYTELSSFFYAFSVWDKDVCLSWDESLLFFELLGITHVPIIYTGLYDESLIRGLKLDKAEGYCIRIAESFTYDAFKYNMAKFVRPNHVQTDTHWMHSSIVPNCCIQEKI